MTIVVDAAVAAPAETPRASAIVVGLIPPVYDIERKASPKVR